MNKVELNSIDKKQNELKYSENNKSLAIGNEELVHECFPKHSRVGITRMK